MASRNSWQAFAGLRGLLGLAEGSANPAGMKATAEWFPAKERGLAGGVYNIGASVGSMLAPPLGGLGHSDYNWRSAFVITGCLGLVWVVLWLLFYQSPARHPRSPTEERDYIAAGQEKHLRGDGSVHRSSGSCGSAISGASRCRDFSPIPTWGTLTFWLPLYLSTVRHMDLKQIALFAWLPFLAADFGCMFGGVVAMATAEARRPERDQRAPLRVHARRRPDDGRGLCRRSSRVPTRRSRCSASAASRTRRCR